MIKEAILAHPAEARAGIGRATIKKYIQSHHPETAKGSEASFNTRVNQAITRGAEKKTFVLPKGPSGKVKLAPKAKVEKKPAAAKKPAAKKVAAKKPAAKKPAAKKVCSSSSSSPSPGQGDWMDAKGQPKSISIFVQLVPTRCCARLDSSSTPRTPHLHPSIVFDLSPPSSPSSSLRSTSPMVLTSSDQTRLIQHQSLTSFFSTHDFYQCSLHPDRCQEARCQEGCFVNGHQGQEACCQEGKSLIYRQRRSCMMVSLVRDHVGWVLQPSQGEFAECHV